MSDELDEVWGLYADEGEQSLEAMEDALLILKSTPTDTSMIGSLFRAMHTFKGNSRVMGLSVIESRAHVAEDLIGLVRDEGVPLDEELVDLLLEMVDVLHPMLSEVCNTQLDASPELSNDLVARMKDKLARCRDIKNGVVPTVVEESAPVTENVAMTFEPVVEPELEAIIAEHELEIEDDAAPLAIIFDNTESLANDPIFRELFSSMANDIFKEMDEALAELKTDSTLATTHFFEASQRLQIAAEQIKLPEWQTILGEFLAITEPTEDQIKALHSHLLALFERDFSDAELPAENDDELEPVIGVNESELILEDDESESVDEEETPAEPLAIIFDNTETLANDPVYRELFSSMANDIFKEMRDALAEFETDVLEQAQIHFSEACQRLQVAAEQIKLPEWQAVLGEFLAQTDATEAQANALYARLSSLFERDFGNAETPIEVEAIQAMIFDKTESLANDPVYLEIFTGMAHDILREMGGQLKNFAESPTLAQTSLLEEATRLLFYAKQIGLYQWQTKLEEFLTLEFPTFEQADALIEQLNVLFTNLEVISHGDVDNDDSNVQFFAALQKPLHVFFIYSQIEKEVNVTVDIEELIEATREIKTLAESFGFLHLVGASERFLVDVETNENVEEAVHRFEFQLYEGLVAIENVASEKQINTGFDAKTLLGTWCANRVFENLLLINNILDSVKNDVEVSENCVQITPLLREVYYACLHYKLDTAAHLCTSLSDLFARVMNDVMKLDAVMVHIAKSFIADMELVLASVGSGDIPDMKLIEKLLDEASTATFVSSGTLSSQSIEARLSLPKSFHKVLTAESVKTATAALENGETFCIIRADLEQDEELACNFLNWIESGAVKAISNVTVFDNNRTLFDFLLATPLNFIQIGEALTTLDSSGKAIIIERELTDRKSGGAEHVPNDDVFLNETATPTNSSHGQMSSSMLESIGELVTHQAMVQHILDELVKDDLIKIVLSKTKGLHGQLAVVREELCDSLFYWQEKIEKMVQIGVQTGVLLSQLQEEAISGRMRSVSQLLKPLVPFVEALAQKNQRIVNFTMEGDEILLDITMLENLKSPVRALLGFCILQSIETPERRAAKGKEGRGSLRVMLVEREDHVQVIIEDDGIGIDIERVAQRAAQLGWNNEKPKLDMAFRKEYGITTNDDDAYGGLAFSDIKEFLSPIGGNLMMTNLPAGGIRFTVSMSLTMLLLDGMVVRVGAVQYIIPIDSIQRIVRTDSESLMRLSAEDGRYMLNIENGEIIPVQFLKGNHEEVIAIEDEFIHDEKHLFVIVINKQKQCVAIKVSELIGQQNILSRPLQGYLSHIRGVIGCSLLGSGDVGLVLDINGLFGDGYTTH
jgi:two-component system chemotaxis sensor kinase CheA